MHILSTTEYNVKARGRIDMCSRVRDLCYLPLSVAFAPGIIKLPQATTVVAVLLPPLSTEVGYTAALRLLAYVPGTLPPSSCARALAPTANGWAGPPVILRRQRTLDWTTQEVEWTTRELLPPVCKPLHPLSRSAIRSAAGPSPRPRI